MIEKIKQVSPQLQKYLFTVTAFSKILAAVLFITFPFLGFYLGEKYQEKVTIITPIVSKVQKIPTSTPAPTPIINATTEFKIYSNNNYHFTFQYPSYLTRLEDHLPKIPNGTSTSSLRITSLDYKYDLQLYINPRFGGMCRGTVVYEAKRSKSVLVFTKSVGGNPDLPKGMTCSPYYETHIDLGNQNNMLMTFGYDDKNLNAQIDFEKILYSFKFTQ